MLSKMILQSYSYNDITYYLIFITSSIRHKFLCHLQLQEEFEDTKGVIRIRIQDRQHNVQTKKYKKDKQRSTKYIHTTKDRVNIHITMS